LSGSGLYWGRMVSLHAIGLNFFARACVACKTVVHFRQLVLRLSLRLRAMPRYTCRFAKVVVVCCQRMK
jgi:hypothetical protein